MKQLNIAEYEDIKIQSYTLQMILTEAHKILESNKIANVILNLRYIIIYIIVIIILLNLCTDKL